MKTFIRIAVVSALVALGCIATELFTKPLHEAGRAQWLTARLNVVGEMLQTPGKLFWKRTGNWRSPEGHRRPPGDLPVAGVSAALCFISLYAAVGLYRGAARLLCRPTLPGNPEANQARRISRRTVLRRSTQSLVGAAAATASYAMFVEPRWFGITRRSISIAGLPPALDGLTIAQLTDIHHGPWLSVAHVRDIVGATNALRPDVVVLTGDYVHRSPVYINPVARELAALRPAIATLGVLGNHDWWEDGQRSITQLGRAGVRLIDNSRAFISPSRRLTPQPAGLCIAGVGDLWEDQQDYDAALARVPDDVPRLLLSHNPDVAEERRFISCGHRVDLMLSGHTHGGQVCVPFYGAIRTSSRFGPKYASGLVQGPTTRVLVSRGLGPTFLPVRFNAYPEIVLLTLTRASPATATLAWRSSAAK